MARLHDIGSPLRSSTRGASAPATQVGGALPGRTEALSPWRPGAAFNKYHLDSRLAAGGMAEVWRAKIKGAQGFEKRIVIKTMHTALQSRPELVQMFINEASIAAQLGHPHIVQVFDFGQLEGRYFIAMEYVPGVTLRIAHKRAVARRERLPVPTVLHVMMDVCDALEHVHAAADGRGELGLVHRDISPDNIIISTSGSAKLIDFGAARATARTRRTPVFVGKYRYAAPERIQSTGEDRRSDVFSVGVILYECLAGRRPFEGTDTEVIRAVLASRGCDPRARVPGLSGRLAELVVKATAHDPAERFASARELRLALAACLDEVGGASKERDVTGALAALLEAPAIPDRSASAAPASEAEAVPEPIGVPSRDDAAASGDSASGSDAEIALCEVEMLEASGPIRKAEPPTLPLRAPAPSAKLPPAAPPASSRPPPSIFSAPLAPWGTAVRGWRTTTEVRPPERQRTARDRAVELFDRGLELRGDGHYGEALDAWERALALAPDNHIYQANVQRLRDELDRLRADTPASDVLSALRVVRPSLGDQAGVGLYRLLRLAAFDATAGAEAIAAARAAGEKIGRSLGMRKLDDLAMLCRSLKLGIVDVSIVTETCLRIAVRECAACAGAQESGDVVCHFEGGLLAGAVGAIFERSVRFRETTCLGGHGDDACRFEIDFV